MSGSENDFSESSNLESPDPQDTPYSSPSQQVPQLANAFSGIKCEDGSMHHHGNGPCLRIVEQPQDYFRFRYKSEMVGTHGCILGRMAAINKARSHPTVELLNYTGNALIRVRLSQADKDEEHPHKLLEDDVEDCDVSTHVPQQGSYRVGFMGMGIIHTAKKDVKSLLFKKYRERPENRHKSDAELNTICENTAKTINLNIVRLKFSAHDLATDKEICQPVFSEPIHNMKSAATNDLKVTRMSRYVGKPKGGEEVFILVEKVNKKNILVRFYELNDNGEMVWSANGNFNQSDVHHQYAIVFRTPAYRDLYITSSVKVFVELVRPSDGRCSEPQQFEYRPEHAALNNKRRRNDSSRCSSVVSGGSIKSLCEVPATVEMVDQGDDPMSKTTWCQITIPSTLTIPTGQCTGDLGDALLLSAGLEGGSPMLGAPNVPAPPVPSARGVPNVPGHVANVQMPTPPVLSLNSAELDRLIRDDNLPPDHRKKFAEMDWDQYIIDSYGDSLNEKSVNGMDWLGASMEMVADGGVKVEVKEEPVSPSSFSTAEGTAVRQREETGESAQVQGYTAVYSPEDGAEVKRLVKEICEVIKNKRNGFNKALVRAKIERVFEMRLSNGDTFLHMALCSNHSSFEFIVNLINFVRMFHLLNLANDRNQTILHLAIINDSPRLVDFLLSKGCDPTCAEADGNTAWHCAAASPACLRPLLRASRLRTIDLNATNNERQTALHLAALHDAAESVELLLEAGASYNTRDGAGRTPLHLALCTRRLCAAAALARRTPPMDIDALDGMGNTALQIICGSNDICPQGVEIVKILLEKKADGLRHEASNISAWRLARLQPALRAVFEGAGAAVFEGAGAAVFEGAGAAPSPGPDDVKSEPEDEFESADEGEYCDSVSSDSPL